MKRMSSMSESSIND